MLRNTHILAYVKHFSLNIYFIKVLNVDMLTDCCPSLFV